MINNFYEYIYISTKLNAKLLIGNKEWIYGTFNVMSSVVTDIVAQIYHSIHRYLQMLVLFSILLYCYFLLFLHFYVDFRIFYISIHFNSGVIFICHFPVKKFLSFWTVER